MTELVGLNDYLERDWVADPEIIVLRDDKLFPKGLRRGKDFIKNLPFESMVNFQDFGLRSDKIYQTLSTPEFQRRWTVSEGQLIDSPMNLLNISSHNFEITPPPLLSRCSHSTMQYAWSRSMH